MARGLVDSNEAAQIIQVQYNMWSEAPLPAAQSNPKHHKPHPLEAFDHHYHQSHQSLEPRQLHPSYTEGVDDVLTSLRLLESFATQAEILTWNACLCACSRRAPELTIGN